MAFTSTGLGQTCSNSISPLWCAATSFMPSIKSGPKLLFLLAAFFRILLRSVRIGRDLPQLFLLVRSQIALDVLGVATISASSLHRHRRSHLQHPDDRPDRLRAPQCPRFRLAPWPRP